MAIKNKAGKWICSYCEKEYPTPALADTCRDDHDIIYLALSREDLSRLTNFLFIQDRKLLRPALIKKLQRALRTTPKTLDKSI